MDDRQELEDLRRLDELETRARISGVEKPRTTFGESVAEGLKKGGSLGFSDRIAGAIDVGLKASGNLFVPKGGQNPYKDQSISDTYNQGVQDERAGYDKAMSERPASTTIATAVGGLPSAIATGGSLGAATALGATAGLGNTRDMTDVPQVAKDIGLGGGLGLAGGALTSAPSAAKAVYNNPIVKPIADKAGGFVLNNIPMSGVAKSVIKAIKNSRGAVNSVEKEAAALKALDMEKSAARQSADDWARLQQIERAVVPTQEKIAGDEIFKIARRTNNPSVPKSAPTQETIDPFTVRKFRKDIGNTNGEGVGEAARREAVESFIKNQSINK